MKIGPNGNPLPPAVGGIGAEPSSDRRAAKSLQTIGELSDTLSALGLGRLDGKKETQVRQGPAENPPAGRGKVRERRATVSNFFSKAKQALSSGWQKIKTAFKEAAWQISNRFPPQINTNVDRSTETKTQIADRALNTLFERDHSFRIASSSLSIAMATETQNPEKLTRIVASLAEDLQTQFEKYASGDLLENNMDVNEYCADRLDLKGGTDGPTMQKFAFLDENRDNLHAMLPQLRLSLAGNDYANRVLDTLENVPAIATKLNAEFTEQTAVLGTAESDTFMRTDNFYSKAMGAKLARSMDLHGVASTSLVSANRELRVVAGDFGRATNNSLRPADMNASQSEHLMAASSATMTALFGDGDNIGSVRAAMPEEYRLELRGRALEIAQREDLSVEDRNTAIEIMYTNDIMLRSVNPVLSFLGAKMEDRATSNGVRAVSVVVLSVANGIAEPDRGTDAYNQAYSEMFDTFRPRMMDMFVGLGMPVVE